MSLVRSGQIVRRFGFVLAMAGALTVRAAEAQQPTQAPSAGLVDSLRTVAAARAEAEARAAAIARETALAERRLADLRQELVVAAYAVQDAETIVTALNRRIDEARVERDALSPQLHDTQSRLFQSVLALHRVASDSPLARLASREDPNRVVRAGIVMATLAPHLQNRAHDMAARLEALREMDQALTRQLAEVSMARDRLADERARIDRLRAEMDLAYASQSEALITERARAAALAGEVESLTGLIAALRRAAAEAPQVTIEITMGDDRQDEPTPVAMNGVTDDGFAPPVHGQLAVRFGQSVAGIAASGIRLAALPHAQVVSPFAGHVAYAGDFPGRGLVLIIDHGGGYHSVLTGLARIDTAVGRQLLAGEPVGVLGGRQTTHRDEETADDGSSREGAELYYELRRDGSPIDPMPWFSTVSDRMNG